MLYGKTFLAIIPARGGSKRLPRKNVLDLAGKPLIAWTIEAALECTFIDEVMVTTDDEEIAQVARRFGANVPFLRPAILSGDMATSFDAIKHTINFYIDKLDKGYDYVILLQPTSPLRTSRDIVGSVDVLFQKKSDAVISVCEADHSPLWMNTLTDDHSLAGFIREEALNQRSQDLQKYYRLNGAIYICKTDNLLEDRSFFLSKNIFAYTMEKEDSIDIDDLFDFRLANLILSSRE